MNLSMEKKQTHGRGKQNFGCLGKWEGSGMDWEQMQTIAFVVDKQ